MDATGPLGERARLGGVRELARAEIERLRALPFSYDHVGSTLTGRRPPGAHALSRSRVLAGRDLDALADRLLGWAAQRGAGLAVRAEPGPIAEGSVVLLRLGLGPLGLAAPCRVVGVVEEPDRRGFAYGTLEGHPESGEELFVLDRDAAGAITFTVTAFSRPASVLTRAAGPAGRLAQRVMAQRYLSALDRG